MGDAAPLCPLLMAGGLMTMFGFYRSAQPREHLAPKKQARRAVSPRESLMSLIFGLMVLAVSIGITHLLGIEIQKTALGLEYAVYLGIFFFGVLAFHKLSARPGTQRQHKNLEKKG